METGQKIIQQSNNIDQKLYNILSIQVSLSGLSFCILNTQSNSITFHKQSRFEKKANPSELLDKLVHTFNSENELNQDFKSVNVIHENELSALVPKPLFNEDYLADYLKFNSKILRSDFITYDDIIINDSVNVYVPYVNINNYLYDRFGEFEFKHYSTIVLENILAIKGHSNETKMYAHVSADHFELIVLENNDLKLYNTFDYSTKEDFIYYILFTAEQLQLNPEEFLLVLLGNVSKEDELFNVAYNFIRNVSILDFQKTISIDEQLNSDGLQNNFIILNSF